MRGVGRLRCGERCCRTSLRRQQVAISPRGITVLRIEVQNFVIACECCKRVVFRFSQRTA